MTPALLGMLVCSFFLLFGTLVLGYVPSLAGLVLGKEFLSVHIILGVIASLSSLFTVCMIMFYLIGTGKQIKREIREHGLNKKLYDPVKRGKKRFFPTLTVAMVLYVALPCVGAATTVNYVSSGFHGLVALVTIVTHLWVCYQSWFFLRENDRVIVTINQKLGSEPGNPAED